MIKLNNDQVTTIIWFMIGVMIGIGSIGYGLGSLQSPGSGFITFLAALVVCFLSLIGFVEATRDQRKGIGWKPVLVGVFWWKPLIVTISLLAYAFLLNDLGFVLSTAFLIGFLLRAVNPQRWMVVIAGGILSSLGAYAIFEVWLQAQLPKGPWGF